MSRVEEFEYYIIEHQIFYIPEVNARLNSLCELDNNGIIKLIEVQRNLKYFEWKSDYDIFVNFSKVFYENLSQAIVKQAHTLAHFIISADDDYFVCTEILTKLHKLRTLKLKFNEIFESTYKGKLINSVYSNLEILQINDYIPIDTVICLIKNSEGHLREILINHYVFDIDWNKIHKQSLSLICAIYEKCPLVEYLSLALPLSKEHFIKFEKLLKVCQKLRVLLLQYLNDIYYGVNDMHDVNVKELLKVLIKSAPINLREIRLSDFKISLKTLEEFLENWRVKRQPALTILTCNHNYYNYFKEEYTELISRYKNYGVIKDFRIVSRNEMYANSIV